MPVAAVEVEHCIGVHIYSPTLHTPQIETFARYMETLLHQEMNKNKSESHLVKSRVPTESAVSISPSAIGVMVPTASVVATTIVGGHAVRHREGHTCVAIPAWREHTEAGENACESCCHTFSTKK